MITDKDRIQASLEFNIWLKGLAWEVIETASELRIPGRVYRFSDKGYLRSIWEKVNGHYVKVS